MTENSQAEALKSTDPATVKAALWKVSAIKTTLPMPETFATLNTLMASNDSEIRERAVFIAGILWNYGGNFAAICDLVSSEDHPEVLSAAILAVGIYAKNERYQSMAGRTLIRLMLDVNRPLWARAQAQGVVAVALQLISQDEYFEKYGMVVTNSKMSLDELQHSPVARSLEAWFGALWKGSGYER